MKFYGKGGGEGGGRGFLGSAMKHRIFFGGDLGLLG